MKKDALRIAAGFLILMSIHSLFWLKFVGQDFVILLKFYLFFVMMNMFVFTIIYLIYLTAKDYLGFSMIGLMFFKFLMLYFIIKKINFSQVDYYKTQVMVPYLFFIIALTWLTAVLLKTDKKH